MKSGKRKATVSRVVSLIKIGPVLIQSKSRLALCPQRPENYAEIIRSDGFLTPLTDIAVSFGTVDVPKIGIITDRKTRAKPLV